MEKHFVKFFSPGIFVSETTILEIEAWDVELAIEKSKTIVERHGARPYGFSFLTKARNEYELDSKVVNESGMYFLGGNIYSLNAIKERNDPKDEVLIFNMEANNIPYIIENSNSYKIAFPFTDDDHLIRLD